MGKNQGLNNLTKGFNRRLTQSEVSRGYLFISKDRAILKILDEGFKVRIGEIELKNKKLDSSGRITIGKVLSSKLAEKEIRLKLEKNNLLITY